MSLIDATFEWIEDNLKGEIDFIIWTGDNARHDNDHKLPRSEKVIAELNELMVQKFTKVFGSDDPRKAFEIPIIPSVGNNDVYPHNIFGRGPNAQTKRLYQQWRSMVPEEQVHVFDRGVSFMVEAIPGKLAVLSLNTLYWFKSNNLVDGCDGKNDPGHLQFRWLAIVLRELRRRNMKVWLSGHVPPSPKVYDPTCLDRFSAWLYAYRDIIIGGVYGHMNVDHFLLHDSLDKKKKKSDQSENADLKEFINFDDGRASIFGKVDYLQDLRGLYSEVREDWSRYAVSYVSPSVIPTYLPGLRVWEYNTTGINDIKVNTQEFRPWSEVFREVELEFDAALSEFDDDDLADFDELEEQHILLIDSDLSDAGKKKKHKKKKDNKKKKGDRDPTWPPEFPEVIAGPAYTPQTFTPTKYTQYFLNLTDSNSEGAPFNYDVEYTTDDEPYGLDNLLVSSWVKLARKLGAGLLLNGPDNNNNNQIDLLDPEYQNQVHRAWKTFVQYFFVSSGFEKSSN
ncbi:hypothetical protein D0Z00_002816 [Geotrichum galactomycetum]|uniref:Uncharacterized protein n=1 Tax=Geotrichum galactomycetum TaxID=27317 RepID=A0ACB6V368_9ASCO|nr:hypothetical protein D0Z00_002816 [Geotrichum candidum]